MVFVFVAVSFVPASVVVLVVFDVVAAVFDVLVALVAVAVVVVVVAVAVVDIADSEVVLIVENFEALVVDLHASPSGIRECFHFH